MKRLAFCLLIGATLSFAQGSKPITISSPASAAVTQGVTVNLSYTIPADDPFLALAASDPAAAPDQVFIYWGDDRAGAPKRTVVQLKYAVPLTASHVYAGPGEYGIQIVVIDVKKRGVRQDSVTVKINQPVEVK